MFQGTIPPEARSMIRALAGDWNAPDIYVGCSGNFTIERSLADLGVRLHSNDVRILNRIPKARVIWLASRTLRDVRGRPR